MSDTNGTPRDLVHPMRVGRFAPVVDLFHAEGRPAGWSRMRDVLLGGYEAMKQDMQAAVILKLAIDCDRQALFAEVAESKDRAGDDQKMYQWFQDYLQGTTDVAPAATVGAVGPMQSAVPVTTQDDPEDDDEGEEDLNERI